MRLIVWRDIAWIPKMEQAAVCQPWTAPGMSQNQPALEFTGFHRNYRLEKINTHKKQLKRNN